MSRNRARSRARALSIFSDSAISLDFIPIAGTSPALDPRITFTRSTTGTYVNSAGVVASAAINEPRFDYDPVTRALKGLLIEESRTNLLTYSEQFDNAAWSLVRASITSNTIGAPDGTLTADKLVEDTTAANTHVTRRGGGISITTGTAYTFSCFMKAAGRTHGALLFDTTNSVFAANSYVIFSLTDGSITLNPNSLPASITSFGNGWYRCSVTATSLATALGVVGIYTALSNTLTTNGDGTSGIYIWGAQLETGSFPTSYIPTTTAAVTRAADLASMTGTNFSSWYNQTEGTIYLQAQCLAAITAQTYLAIDNGTSNNLITVRTSPSNATFERSQVVDGGVTQAALGSSGYVATSINDFAFAYKANDFARSFNGSSVATDTSGTVPTVNQMFIGSERGQYFVNGHIRRIVYYPTRLSNEELRALTSYSRNIPLWTPAQISTALWLDAADASTITLNGSTVSQWNDKSGNGRNVSQPTASAQPTSNTRTLNGLNVLDFNVDIIGRSTPFVTINTPWLVYSVITFDNFTGNPVYIGLQGAQTTHIGWSSNGNIQFYNPATGVVGLSGSVITANTPALVGVQYDTTNLTGIYNGAAQGSPAVTIPADTALFNIGSHASGASNYFDGAIGEIVFIQSTVSLSNRQKLEGYLAWKWGLQANLPVGHPYKNAPPLL